MVECRGKITNRICTSCLLSNANQKCTKWTYIMQIWCIQLLKRTTYYSHSSDTKKARGHSEFSRWIQTQTTRVRSRLGQFLSFRTILAWGRRMKAIWATEMAVPSQQMNLIHLVALSCTNSESVRAKALTLSHVKSLEKWKALSKTPDLLTLPHQIMKKTSCNSLMWPHRLVEQTRASRIT